MASQRIRFAAPPGETVTLDVWNAEFPSLGASATHANVVCVEQTAGEYLTNVITGTLAGRCKFSKKISGSSIGIDFVTMVNSDGTYVAEQLQAGPEVADVADVLAEVRKIPRASGELSAGAQHKRTNQAGDFIRETISAP